MGIKKNNILKIMDDLIEWNLNIGRKPIFGEELSDGVIFQRALKASLRYLEFYF